MKNYLLNLAIGIDQLANAFIGGSADETLSARAHRMRAKRQRWWGWTASAIDRLFFWQRDHCLNAHLAELQRAQLPKPYHAAADTPSSTPTTKATP